MTYHLFYFYLSEMDGIGYREEAKQCAIQDRPRLWYKDDHSGCKVAYLQLVFRFHFWSCNLCYTLLGCYIMVAVDLDNIVQFQPPPCTASSQAHGFFPGGSAHFPSDTRLRNHQAPPNIPWSSPYPLPAISSLQADADCVGGFHSPHLGTELATNILDDTLKESPPRDSDGDYRAWTEFDHRLGDTEIMPEPGSTDSRNQDCLVGDPYGPGICHQHNISKHESFSSPAYPSEARLSTPSPFYKQLKRPLGDKG